MREFLATVAALRDERSRGRARRAAESGVGRWEQNHPFVAEFVLAEAHT